MLYIIKYIFLTIIPFGRLFSSRRRMPPEIFILALIVAIAGLLAYLISKGYALAYYYKSKLSKSSKDILITLHGIISILPGFILPNNFLVKIHFFENLYSKNALWIPVSMIVIMLILVTITGILITKIVEIKTGKTEG